MKISFSGPLFYWFINYNCNSKGLSTLPCLSHSFDSNSNDFSFYGLAILSILLYTFFIISIVPLSNPFLTKLPHNRFPSNSVKCLFQVYKHISTPLFFFYSLFYNLSSYETGPWVSHPFLKPYCISSKIFSVHPVLFFLSY